LTYGTTATINTGTKRFGVTVATSPQNWYSFWIEAWIAQSALANTPFPLSTNGPASFSLNNGYEWDGAASIANLTGEDGFRYVDAGGVETAIFAGVRSLGAAAGLTGEYQQVAGGAVTNAKASGPFNQQIQVYGDASHGNFDYRDHLVLKFQANGYREARADVVAIYGALADQAYVVALEPAAITDLTPGDPGITGVTVTDHGATPVSWDAGDGAKNFSITILDSGVNSGQDILAWLNYHLSLDATFEGKNPFNWPEMVLDNGAAFETLRGIVEGGVGAALKGVRVLRGASAHPDFTRFQADSGAYATPPTVAHLAVTDIVPGSRIQIYNVTTATEVVNAVVPGASYTAEYLDGTGYTAGDTVRVRITYQSGASAMCGFQGTTLVGPTGWGIAAEQGPCPVYAALGLDGSDYVGQFDADYVDTEVDIIVAANFLISEWYAWWAYNLTTEEGIRSFFGGVTAVDVGNYLINNSVVNIRFDNTTSTEIYALDNRRVYRADGTRPVKNPTSGGGGIDIEWREKVLLAETGVSGLTPEESAALIATAAAAVKVDELHRIQGLKSGEPMTVTPTSRVAGDIALEISGDGISETTVTRQ
jgi:hypothetical protein